MTGTFTGDKYGINLPPFAGRNVGFGLVPCFLVQEIGLHEGFSGRLTGLQPEHHQLEL